MPSVNDGFSYSDFTNKQDFTNKINGKGQPEGHVLTTNGTKSYWAPVGGSGSGLQGIQGIQGISGGGVDNYYYICRYDNLTNYNTPIEINSLHDHACESEYTDEILVPEKGEVHNVHLRDVTLTPVTTTCPGGKMVVDERSPFAFGTCNVDTYAREGILSERDLSTYPIAALYWKPNSTSRSYTYFKDGETGGGVGNAGCYVGHDAMRYITNSDGNDPYGIMFVLGIDLGWTQKNDGDWNFSRAMQSDHYLLIDNQDGVGGDAIILTCPKIFIKNVIQNPVMCLNNNGVDNNYVMDPYKNVRFTAMDNGFVIGTNSMMLFHLCIRRFPYLAPENIDRDTYRKRYEDCNGIPDETNYPNNICDTLFVSLDWTPYKADSLMALSDTITSIHEEGSFYIDGTPYHIE